MRVYLSVFVFVCVCMCQKMDRKIKNKMNTPWSHRRGPCRSSLLAPLKCVCAYLWVFVFVSVSMCMCVHGCCMNYINNKKHWPWSRRRGPCRSSHLRGTSDVPTRRWSAPTAAETPSRSPTCSARSGSPRDMCQSVSIDKKKWVPIDWCVVFAVYLRHRRWRQARVYVRAHP